jgi:SRSO17 transposase
LLHFAYHKDFSLLCHPVRKEGDTYKSKPEIPGGIVKELLEKGFKIKRVLGDSEYGESGSNFLSVLEELGIE